MSNSNKIWDNVPEQDRQELHRQGFDFVGDEALKKGAQGLVFMGKCNELAKRVVDGQEVELNGQCVIKVCVKEGINTLYEGRLEYEAEMLATLRHPNIVDAYLCLPLGDHFYFVFEHMDGGTLEERLSPIKPDLTEYEALQAIRQLTTGLHFMQQHQVIHGDLHSSNIMMRTDEHGDTVYKIIDLGSARPISQWSAKWDTKKLCALFVRILQKSVFATDWLKMSLRKLCDEASDDSSQYTMSELNEQISKLLTDDAMTRMQPHG